MPPRRNTTILFDLYHNEMLDVENEEFSEFFTLLKQQNAKILKNETQLLTMEILSEIDILIIGNPINTFFNSEEIKAIENYVRMGGNIMLISEYGADYLQKSNLNDLATKFGLYFSSDIVKEKNALNLNCPSIISLKSFDNNSNGLLSHIKDVLIGGSCSLLIDRNAQGFLLSNKRTWIENYDGVTKTWIINNKNKESIILGAFAEHGKGKIIGLGDIDIFSNDPNIGINVYDNRKLILNMLNWLEEPVLESKLQTWALFQFGTLQNQIKEINSKLNNIIETLTILEQRISILEKNTNNMVVSELYEQVSERNDL